MSGERSQGRGSRASRVVRVPATKLPHLQKRAQKLQILRNQLQRKQPKSKG